MRPSVDYSCYLVTDRPLCLGRSLEEVVAGAVEGGVTVVQLREKDCPGREFVELGRALHGLLSPLGVPLIINDRVDVAMAVGAEGVHVGQSDMHVEDVRRLMGADAIVGLSVETMGQAVDARKLDVDYLGVGPIFPTATKADAAAPWGVDGLAGLAGTCDLPLIAIGSVTAANGAELVRAGASGLAVVSAICSAPSPRDAARELARAVRDGRS